MSMAKDRAAQAARGIKGRRRLMPSRLILVVVMLGDSASTAWV